MTQADVIVASGRKPTSAQRIDAELQGPLRRRLQLLRESLGLARTDVKTITSGTLTMYELHDISSMRLGDLFSLAEEYGMEFLEFLSYLTSTDADVNANVAQRRVLTYFNRLSVDDQSLACDLVRTLASRREKDAG